MSKYNFKVTTFSREDRLLYECQSDTSNNIQFSVLETDSRYVVNHVYIRGSDGLYSGLTYDEVVDSLKETIVKDLEKKEEI